MTSMACLPSALVVGLAACLAACGAIGPGPTADTPSLSREHSDFAWELQQTIEDFARYHREIGEVLQELDPEARREVVMALGRLERLESELRLAQDRLHVAPESDWRQVASDAELLIERIEQELERIDSLLGPAALHST